MKKRHKHAWNADDSNEQLGKTYRIFLQRENGVSPPDPIPVYIYRRCSLCGLTQRAQVGNWKYDKFYSQLAKERKSAKP